MKLILSRWGTTPFGTFGDLILKDGNDVLFRGRTVEQHWNNNEPYKSCIPSGTYNLVDYDSPKYGKTYAIEGGTVSVYESPDHKRFACLIHAANKASQLQGCIAVGCGNGFWEDELAVVSSRSTLEVLFPLLEKADKPIELIIKQPVIF